ncbi:hypothetical protein EMEDMD4_1310103 [Sinorhizobium medicae]|uniref:Uncharacterized protein n=1 Tax=Sinorhizobium medicae TaxID=110321 RepID=A0A508WWQ0_9HYPH|nr:hypothetical protein EMEDMD4_1310103 [Sinorhizobium medicae]
MLPKTISATPSACRIFDERSLGRAALRRKNEHRMARGEAVGASKVPACITDSFVADRAENPGTSQAAWKPNDRWQQGLLFPGRRR